MEKYARHASSLWVMFLNIVLVVGCGLGVVHLEVCLIASLLPWSSGKSERRICSTLRKLITSVN
jgi:hypothetical protein